MITREGLVVETVDLAQDLILPDQPGAENQRIVGSQCHGNSGPLKHRNWDLRQ